MGFDGGIEKDSNPWGEFFIPFPKNIGQGDFWKYLQGESSVSIKDFAPAQSSACLKKGVQIFSIKLLQFINMEAMGTSEEGGPPPEIFLTDPGMAGFGLFGFRQVDEDHEVEKWGKLFLYGFVIPFHPQYLLCLWKDQVPQIIDWQYEAIPGGIIECLCSIADVGRVKFGEFLPIEGIEGTLLVRLFLHSLYFREPT